MTRILAIALGVGGLAACATAPLRVASLDEVERVRSTAGASEGAKLAPEAYAHAEEEREYAREAHALSDEVGASLHAERAIAAYGHALAVARFSRATAELADAQKALYDATTQEAGLEASRARLQHEAEELDERVHLAQDRLLPAPAAQATPEREAARIVASRSLGVEARLLCAAARLVSPAAPGLADAELEVTALEGPPRSPDRTTAKATDATRTAATDGRSRDERVAPRKSPIDEAARARARCLDVLTKARRGRGYDAGAADALLAELSSAGGWDPSRDERGIVVTLRNVFRGVELTDAGAAKLKELGRVAAAHALFGVEVVVHDARAQTSGETTDEKRGDAAVDALVHAGADPARVRAELAGAFAPVADPNDVAARARNERLEVVFVGRGEL